jgi:predicted methyltransferase
VRALRRHDRRGAGDARRVGRLSATTHGTSSFGAAQLGGCTARSAPAAFRRAARRGMLRAMRNHRSLSTTAMTLCLTAALATAPRAATAFLGEDAADETQRIARALELRPGAVVADVGAGDGSYAIALAAIVGPEGHVFATELDDEALEDVRENVAKKGLANVTVLKGAAGSTNLPPGCCDAVLLRDVYHHLTEPAAMDASILASLRPGGRLAVIDFPPSFWLAPWTPDGVPEDRGGHGVPIEVVQRELAAAGFEPVAVEPDWSDGWLLDLFCVVVRKPAS